MNHGSLFSGIGGFEIAAEWMGWENVFHCEWNEFGQKVLKYYWPKSISYGDIKKTDFTIHRGNIDILTGGFPCQPYSLAGQRKGKEDERHLWPQMLRAIREIQPRYVVGENVYGLLNWNGGMVFDEAQADLEAEGYEVQPVILPACAVNAPHRRDRIWFVAYNTNARVESLQQRGENGIYEFGTTSNPAINGYTNGHEETRGKDGCSEQGRVQQFEGMGGERITTNTEMLRGGKLRNEGKEAGTQKSNELFGYKHTIPDWENFPTQHPVCDGNDGISTELVGITFPKFRNESIKAFGNAIVPQVAYEIFKAIEKTRQQKLILINT